MDIESLIRGSWRIRYTVAVVAIALATAAFLPFRNALEIQHWGWLYLVVVGSIAWTAGTGPALLAAALSFLSSNFFFTPPYYTFSVADPRDLIELVVFLVGAAAIGALTGRLREREVEAARNEREATALARLASELAAGSSAEAIIRTASASLSRIEGVQSVVVWLAGDSGLEAHGPGVRFVTENDLGLARESLSEMKALGLPETSSKHERLDVGWPASGAADSCCGAFVPLVTGAGAEGILQVLPGPQGLAPDDVAFLVSVSNLLSVFLASERTSRDNARAEANREAERLKNAIVSAVSHELKTPLVSLTAAVTDLLQPDVGRDQGQVRDRLEAAREDLDRLDSAIGDLLDLSRLQADAWLPHPDLYEAGEIIGGVVAGRHSRERERFRFTVDDEPTPEVYADFAQIERALDVLIDNALRYGPADGPVTLGARSDGDRTRVWVEDCGPGVPEAEKPFVFDRAFRGSSGMAYPGGSGLGLAIASDIVHANGGELTVDDIEPTGARFVLTIPSGRGEEGR